MTIANAIVPDGAPLHANGGDTSSPSQVYSRGIVPGAAKAVLLTSRVAPVVMVTSPGLLEAPPHAAASNASNWPQQAVALHVRLTVLSSILTSS